VNFARVGFAGFVSASLRRRRRWIGRNVQKITGDMTLEQKWKTWVDYMVSAIAFNNKLFIEIHPMKKWDQDGYNCNMWNATKSMISGPNVTEEMQIIFVRNGREKIDESKWWSYEEKPKPTRICNMIGPGEAKMKIMSFEEFCNGGKTWAGRTIEEHYETFIK
jgi:hypothetical protein